jgi:hypothetical protein
MVSLLAERQTELTTLCEQFGVERLEVFGSAATESEFDPDSSDLDLIVTFRDGHDLGPWMRDYFAFRDALADLYGYSVDLVMSSAMKNERFIREANRTRRLLYGA